MRQKRFKHLVDTKDRKGRNFFKKMVEWASANSLKMLFFLFLSYVCYTILQKLNCVSFLKCSGLNIWDLIFAVIFIVLWIIILINISKSEDRSEDIITLTKYKLMQELGLPIDKDKLIKQINIK
jgi:hypothetical protein